MIASSKHYFQEGGGGKGEGLTAAAAAMKESEEEKQAVVRALEEATELLIQYRAYDTDTMWFETTADAKRVGACSYFDSLSPFMEAHVTDIQADRWDDVALRLVRQYIDQPFPALK